MKKILLLLALIGLPLLADPPPLPTPITGKVIFSWNYAADQLSTNQVFILWRSLDLTNWQAAAIIPGTNLNWTMTILPVSSFFGMNVSNFWGQTSLFSNIVSVPAAPTNTYPFSIQRVP